MQVLAVIEAEQAVAEIIAKTDLCMAEQAVAEALIRTETVVMQAADIREL
jgi:hypothetical protein